MTAQESAARKIRAVVHLSALSLWRGLLGFYRSDDLTYAASIAYYALLSMFPFALLAFSLLGRVAASETDRSEVLQFVLRYFPQQFEFITAQIDSLGGSAFTAGVAGTIALVWGALGFFGAISTAVNYAWGVEQTRSYWKHKLFSFFMLLVAGDLRVALTTTHLPLAAVAQSLTRESLEATLVVTERGLRDQFGMAAPRLLVCGLNPHAGEGGLFGDDDDHITSPAAARLRARGVHVDGPIGADVILARKDIDAFVDALQDSGTFYDLLAKNKERSDDDNTYRADVIAYYLPPDQPRPAQKPQKPSKPLVKKAP